MTRAQEKASETYPPSTNPKNELIRRKKLFAYVLGYEQAEEYIREILKKYQKSSAKCMQQSANANEQGEYTYWDGFNDCAVAILRELEND